MKRGLVIAIDGPSASGKSTLARKLAAKFGFDYLDTGSMYRAFAWRAARENIDDRKTLNPLLAQTKITFKKKGGRRHILIDGKDPGDELRDEKIGQIASRLSRNKSVREIMKKKQRDFAKGRRIVLEGRDIGTVIFPKAEVKIFLSASLAERALRRREELLGRGTMVSLKRVKKEISVRDRRDAARKIAPLRKAEDAVVLDTTVLSIPQMVRAAADIIKRKLQGVL